MTKRRPWFIDYRYGIDDSLVLFAPRDRVHGDLERDHNIELKTEICDWHEPSAPARVAQFHGSLNKEMQQFMRWERMRGVNHHRCVECKTRHRRKDPWWHQFSNSRMVPGYTVLKPPAGRILGEGPDNMVQIYLELCDWHEK